MNGLRSIRPLDAASLRGLAPAAVIAPPPTFEMVNPRDLYVEDDYQRHIGGNGIALVRKIYEGFDWARFKPPVCVRLAEADGVLVCIDGQHTATAAASHPKITQIPIMIIAAAGANLRAAAFVGHNRDRLSLTPQAIYRAELASGDILAAAVDRACRAAGAHVLEKPVNLRDRQPTGATIAIGTMKAVVKRHGEGLLTRVLRVLVKVGRGPIKADEIAALSLILAGLPDLDDTKLQAVIGSKSTEAWAAIGAAAAAETGEALGSAVAAAWCRMLNVRSPGPPRKTSKRSSATQLVGQSPRSAPRENPAKPAQEPRRTPISAPSPPRPVQAPPAKPSPPPAAAAPREEGVVRYNGVQIDLDTGHVTHRGQTTRLQREEGVKLVLALARVMPAMLDGNRCALKVFTIQGINTPELLRDLVGEVNLMLPRARLEVRQVKKIGFNLYDLGPAG